MQQTTHNKQEARRHATGPIATQRTALSFGLATKKPAQCAMQKAKSKGKGPSQKPKEKEKPETEGKEGTRT
jgi:hypothetical protein